MSGPAPNSAASDFVALSAQNPWPGLRAFQETDRDFFFGRERETAELLAVVKRASVVVLYGQSGLGKTSLLQAGLFPALERLNFVPVRLRLDHGENAAPLAEQIKAGLAAAFDRAGVKAPQPGARETLWEYFHRCDLDFWGPRNRLCIPVIVLDQFEEVFTLGQKDEATAARVVQFASELESVIEHRAPDAVRERLEQNPDDALQYDLQKQSVKFILSLREDFLPQLDPWRARMPSLLHDRFRLEHMTGAQALSVVERAGRELVEPAVAQDIVDFVSTSQRKRLTRSMEQRDVEPALLSVVCNELNRRRLDKGQPTITRDLLTLEREDIIQSFYERSFEGVDWKVRDWVEDELLTSSGYRKRAAMEDALKLGLPGKDFDLLVDRRLLHREERESVIWLELTHDLLTDPAARSRSEREKRLQAEAVAREKQLRDEEAARKEALWAAERHRNRRLILIFAVLFICAAFGFVGAVWERQHAKAEAARAEAESSHAKAEADRRKVMEAEAREQARLAKESEARAIDSEERLRGEMLRVREQNFAKVGRIIGLAGALIDKYPPDQTAWIHSTKADGLIDQGNGENGDAVVEEATLAIRQVPLDSHARTTRGYQYILSNQPAKALEDFEFIDKEIDSHSDLNALNISVAHAMLGQYKAARAAANQAIRSSKAGSDIQASESQLSRDIQLATGRVLLIDDLDAFYVALHYQLANLAASTGDPSFENDLRLADQKAGSLRKESKLDAYLTALNWAWLQQKTKPGQSRRNYGADYGALVSQGALWERAGFPDWAACYYTEFQQVQQKKADPRYAGMARWAEQQLARLPKGPGCVRLRQVHPSVRQMEQEAREYSVRAQQEKALSRLNEAVRLEPRNVRLLMMRAGIYHDLGYRAYRLWQDASWTLKEAQEALDNCKKPKEKSPSSEDLSQEDNSCSAEKIKKLEQDKPAFESKVERLKKQFQHRFNQVVGDCNTVVNLNRRMEDAYYYRAMARYYLSERKFTADALSDFRETLRVDPQNTGAMYWLSYYDSGLKGEASAKEGLELVRHYHELKSGDSDTLSLQADFEIRLKQYAAALHSIGKAIALRGPYAADGDLFEKRAKAQRGLGISEEQVQRNLADGYFGTATMLRRYGKEKEESAQDASDKGWAALEKLTSEQADEEIRCSSEGTVCQVRQSVSVTSRFICASIESIKPGSTPEARIVKSDRGSQDGITVGSSVSVYSRYSYDKDSDRGAAKIGHGEVLSADPDESVVRIEMDKPEGNGLVREGDILWLKARVPQVAPSSPLWEVARYHIDLLSSDESPLFEYRELYAQETAKLVSDTLAKLEKEIRSSAPRLSADKKNETIKSGKFAGKSVYEVLTAVNDDDVRSFLQDLARKHPGWFAGHSWIVRSLYLTWVKGELFSD